MRRALAFLPILYLLVLLPLGRAGEAPGLAAAERARIEALILQLRSERFEEREAAMAELRKAGPAVQAAVKRLRVSDDPEFAWRVKELLQGAVPGSGDAEAVDVESLIAQFKRETGEARVQLMRRIVEADGNRSRPFLLSVLASEQDGPLLEQALTQLSYLGGGDAESKAVQAFYNQCGEEMKGQVLWTLAGLDPEAARPLVREALKAEGADLKTWAVRSAGRIHDRASAPVLREIARGGENVSAELQTVAVDALIGFRDEALKELLPPLLKSDNESLFEMALRGIGTLKSPEMAKVLLALYGEPKHAESRDAIMLAMGAMGDPSFIPVLTEALSRDRRHRYSALQALTSMRAKEAGPQIAACLSDPDHTVRLQASTALGQLGYREAIPALKKLLTDRIEEVSLAAAVALVNLGDAAGGDKILEMAQQEAFNGVQVRGALQMLATYRIEKGIPLLKQLVAEGRQEAVWPLIELSPDRETFRLALNQMLKSRNDGSERVGELQLALFYSQIHLYDRAARILEKVAKQQPDYGFVHSRLANVYHEGGRYVEAEAAYARWGKFEPEDGTYLNNRAWFYCTAYDKEYVRPAQAVALARRALAQRPEEHFVVDTYGWALYAAGQYEESLKELNRSLSMIEPADKKGQAGERARIARALEKLGRKDEAVAEFRTALADDSKNGELWFEAAGFYASLGRRDEAVDAIHRAVDLGYRNVAGFKLNTEFDALRNDAGFQYAVRRAEEDVRELDRISEEVEKESRAAAPVPGSGRNPVRIIRRQINNELQIIDGQVIQIQ